jgi:hypothetical protein
MKPISLNICIVNCINCSHRYLWSCYCVPRNNLPLGTNRNRMWTCVLEKITSSGKASWMVKYNQKGSLESKLLHEICDWRWNWIQTCTWNFETYICYSFYKYQNVRIPFILQKGGGSCYLLRSIKKFIEWPCQLCNNSNKRMYDVSSTKGPCIKVYSWCVSAAAGNSQFTEDL